MLFVICDPQDIPVYAVLEQNDAYEKFRVLNLNLDIPVEEDLTFPAMITLVDQYGWILTKRYNDIKDNRDA